MCDEQDARSLTSRELVQEIDDLPAGLPIERRGRLIGEDDLWAMYECAGNRDALLLPAGQLVWPSIGTVAQSNRIEHFQAARSRQRRGQTRVELETQLHVLTSRERAQEIVRLKHEPDPEAHRSARGGARVAQVISEHLHATVLHGSERADERE